MAQHYEVKEGETLVINGPANIIVKTGIVPIVGDTPDPPEPPIAAGAATAKRPTRKDDR